MNFPLVLLMLMLLSAVTYNTAAQCGGNLVARSRHQYLNYSTAGNGGKAEDTCTWLISPDKAEPIDAFLVFTWKKFYIRGKMPTCSDYVEIFLTR